MRIDLTTLAPQPPEQGKSARSGQSDTAASAATETSGLDKTSFSFDQTRVQTLASQVLAQPDVRDVKVQALQQSISDGEYSIPPSQIAEALASEYGEA
jgi:flagellar biosynthesis anti-sigma factor FlgM